MLKPFDQFHRDQAKEERLLKRSRLLDEKLAKLNKELAGLRMLREELRKRGKEFPKKELLRLEKAEEKVALLKEELQRNTTEVSVGRSLKFELHAREYKVRPHIASINELD